MKKKTAEQWLKIYPLKGRLKREVEEIERKYEEQKKKQKKNKKSFKKIDDWLGEKK